jgi:transcriptional regulator with XRE-family HTH domain
MGKLFGNYLKGLRDSQGKAQAQLAAEASEKGNKKITQPLLTQLESGSVAQPDPMALNQLAKALDVRVGELVFRIALDLVESYKDSGTDFSKQDDAVLESWKILALRPTNDDGPVLEDRIVSEDEAVSVLRSMNEFMRAYELRDIDSLAQWQKDLPDLEVFWVIAPNFVDNSSPNLRDTVLHNIRRGVHYYYFIREGDADAGGPFYVLLDTLAFLSRQQTPALSRTEIERFVHAVEFPRNVVGLIPSDVVIANPHSPRPVGFRSIRSRGVPVFGVPVGDAELSRLIGNYLSYFRMENVFPELEKKKAK